MHKTLTFSLLLRRKRHILLSKSFFSLICMVSAKPSCRKRQYILSGCFINLPYRHSFVAHQLDADKTADGRMDIVMKLPDAVYILEFKYNKCSRAAVARPSRGGVPEGRGGVCCFFSFIEILTPPLPLPYKGGELNADCLQPGVGLIRFSCLLCKKRRSSRWGLLRDSVVVDWFTAFPSTCRRMLYGFFCQYSHCSCI